MKTVKISFNAPLVTTKAVTLTTFPFQHSDIIYVDTCEIWMCYLACKHDFHNFVFDKISNKNDLRIKSVELPHPWCQARSCSNNYAHARPRAKLLFCTRGMTAEMSLWRRCISHYGIDFGMPDVQ